MNFGLIHSVWTVLLFVLFIGIIVWAWSAKRKPQFDEAARLPLEDEDSHLLPLSQSEEKRAQRATARFPLPLGRGNEGEGSGRGEEEKPHG